MFPSAASGFLLFIIPPCPRLPMKTSSPRPPPRRRAAFTLVEIMIVVVIIGLLAAMAIPAFKRVQESARNNRAINDFRVFSQAFETYATQNGTWPPNAGAG